MSNIWDNYNARVYSLGATHRERSLNKEIRHLSSELPGSLSYHKVMVDADGMNNEDDITEQNVVIIDSDNLDEKYIYSMPTESLVCGSIIEWSGSHWIISEIDANSEVRTKGKMIQCNFVLKWKNNLGETVAQWCVVDDGTKYMTGDEEDRNIVIRRPDARISITITRNANTVKLNRSNRFLVDDEDTNDKMAFSLSKPLKVGNVYNGRGVFIFVLKEVPSAENDSDDLGIADYTPVSFSNSLVTESRKDGTWL